MRSPEGQENQQCRLFPRDIFRTRRLCGPWRSSRATGHPIPLFDVPTFTATIMMEPHGQGDKYKRSRDAQDEVSRDKHERMGSARVGARRSISSSPTPKTM